MGKFQVIVTLKEVLIDITSRYSGGPSAKSEVKTLDGVTRGSYSYIDSNAKLQTVNYVADALGFRVAATNLPVAPVDNGEAPKQVEDTEEVMQARAEHLAAIAKARSESSDPEEADDTETQPEGPKPVEDLPEVKQAREEHLLAVEEAKARNAIAPADIPAPVASKLISPVVVANHVSPVVQYLSAPLAIQAPSSFAYSVYAPGHQQLIYA